MCAELNFDSYLNHILIRIHPINVLRNFDEIYNTKETDYETRSGKGQETHDLYERES